MVSLMNDVLVNLQGHGKYAEEFLANWDIFAGVHLGLPHQDLRQEYSSDGFAQVGPTLPQWVV